ncbi:hypothetical protein LINPERPRIM_LOCUS15926 [Linum perenne]
MTDAAEVEKKKNIDAKDSFLEELEKVVNHNVRDAARRTFSVGQGARKYALFSCRPILLTEPLCVPGFGNTCVLTCSGRHIIKGVLSDLSDMHSEKYACENLSLGDIMVTSACTAMEKYYIGSLRLGIKKKMHNVMSLDEYQNF